MSEWNFGEVILQAMNNQKNREAQAAAQQAQIGSEQTMQKRALGQQESEFTRRQQMEGDQFKQRLALEQQGVDINKADLGLRTTRQAHELGEAWDWQKTQDMAHNALGFGELQNRINAEKFHEGAEFNEQKRAALVHEGQVDYANQTNRIEPVIHQDQWAMQKARLTTFNTAADILTNNSPLKSQQMGEAFKNDPYRGADFEKWGGFMNATYNNDLLKTSKLEPQRYVSGMFGPPEKTQNNLGGMLDYASGTLVGTFLPNDVLHAYTTQKEMSPAGLEFRQGQDLWQRALQNFQNPGSSGNIDYLLQEGGAQPGTPTLYDPSNYKPYNPNSK
jgi:hypothetical protein